MVIVVMIIGSNHSVQKNFSLLHMITCVLNSDSITIYSWPYLA